MTAGRFWGDTRLPVRARQVARPDRPRPFRAVWRFRRISRDCVSFSGGLAMAGFLQARVSIIRLCCTVFILLRSILIILIVLYPFSLIVETGLVSAA